MLEKGAAVPREGSGTSSPRRITATVTAEQKRKLKRYCAYHDVSISYLVRGFIEALPSEEHDGAR